MSLFFPRFCIFCHTILEEGICCTNCSICFQLKPLVNQRQQAVTWSKNGYVAYFMQLLRSHQTPFLIDIAASFMLLQWVNLKWPIPHAIGYTNTVSKALASKIAQALHVKISSQAELLIIDELKDNVQYPYVLALC